MSGRAAAVPICPEGDEDEIDTAFRFKLHMDKGQKKCLKNRISWQSYYLIGDFSMSNENCLRYDLNMEHRTEEDIGLSYVWVDGENECKSCKNSHRFPVKLPGYEQQELHQN